MAGYDGWSKSNNAVQAEADGLMVASKFAAWVRKHGGRRYRGLTAQDVSRLRFAEWHHTSARYNCVAYYDLTSLAAAANREILMIAAAQRRNEKPRFYATATAKPVETYEQTALRLGMTRA